MMGKKDKEKGEKKQREKESRVREERKKSYERKLYTDLPDGLIKYFKEQDLELALKRYRLGGQVEHTHLSRLEEEGWSFVTVSELPEEFKFFFHEEGYRGSRDDVLIRADMVLMKADVELVKSKKAYYDALAQRELESVDINVLQKKGFKDLGTKSSTSTSEPRFK